MIGYTSDNATILVSAANKLSWEQSAQIMSNLGCYGAVMLDGGTSTSMYARGYGSNGIIHSSPEYRPLPNAIVISNK